MLCIHPARVKHGRNLMASPIYVALNIAGPCSRAHVRSLLVVAKVTRISLLISGLLLWLRYGLEKLSSLKLVDR